MLTIKVSFPFLNWPIERQTPGGTSRWNNYQFKINDETKECNFWLVYDDLLTIETANCPPENTILITAEPPDIKTYPQNFIKQFGVVITCHQIDYHDKVIFSQQALPWHVGRMQNQHMNSSWSKNYDELIEMDVFSHKKRLLSVISSNLDITSGHRRRMELVSYLASHFDSRLDLYGRGINEIEDKWDAIYPYKYHIVIENSSLPHYWTEKLGDSFLGGAFPFYYGCTNLSEYFPEDSFKLIPANPEQAAAIIERSIIDNVYDKSLPSLRYARELVLNHYNLFAMVCSYCNQLNSDSERKRVVLKPAREFRSSFTRIIRWPIISPLKKLGKL